MSKYAQVLRRIRKIQGDIGIVPEEHWPPQDGSFLWALMADAVAGGLAVPEGKPAGASAFIFASQLLLGGPDSWKAEDLEEGAEMIDQEAEDAGA
jgi:hypothetical protein